MDNDKHSCASEHGRAKHIICAERARRRKLIVRKYLPMTATLLVVESKTVRDDFNGCFESYDKAGILTSAVEMTMIKKVV